MMSYFQRFIASVKCNGKILRETDPISGSQFESSVHLPFGSHYSLLLKNLHTRRALVNVDIDGQRVMDGLVVDANGTVELERFQDAAHKFKFIEKTQEISDFRGDRIDDGFIRITFKYEKENMRWVKAQPVTWPHKGYDYSDITTRSMGYVQNIGNSIVDMSNFEPSAVYGCSIPNDQGITVKGEQSSQSFTYVTMGEMETEEHCIIIHLFGTKGMEVVQEPVHVKLKKQCPTCGRKAKYVSLYCSNCGTAMI